MVPWHRHLDARIKQESFPWSRSAACLEERCRGGLHSAMVHERCPHRKHLKPDVRESTSSLILSVSLELLKLWVLCIAEVMLASGLPGPTCPQEASERHGPKQTPRGALPTRERALGLLNELPTARPVWTARVAFVSVATAKVSTRHGASAGTAGSFLSSTGAEGAAVKHTRMWPMLPPHGHVEW